MSNLISADNGTFSNTAGIKLTSDTSGAFEIKTGNNVTAVTLSAQQNATFANNITIAAGTANGVSYLNASKVLTTGSALTFDGTTLSVAGLSDSGNLIFTGTGNRIFGDFSNANVSSRLMFQSSTANSATVVSALPNGTVTNGQLRAYNNSDPTNAATAALTAQASYISLQSTIEGTGTYLPMAFFTGGSERVRIDTSGNVGIGTSSPAAPLQLGDATQASREIRTSTLSGAGQGGFFRGYRGGNPSFYVGDSAPILGSSAGGMTLYAYGATSVDTYTNGILRSTLDSSGNLGLGVTPSAWISSWKAIDVVSGGPSLFGSLAIGGIANNAYLDSGVTWRYKTSYAAGFYQIGSTGNHTWNTAPSGTAGNAISFTQAMTLNSSGNLGVGIAAPAAAIDAYREARVSYASGNEYRMRFTNSDGNGRILVDGDTSALIFGTSSSGSGATATERMRIDSSGNVGIGTSAPQGVIDVAGSGIAAQRNYAYIRAGNVGSTNPVANFATGLAVGTNISNGNSETNLIWGQTVGSQQYLSFSKWTGSSVVEQMRIDSSGNLLVGTTSSSGAKLNVNGDYQQRGPNVRMTQAVKGINGGVNSITVDVSGGLEAVSYFVEISMSGYLGVFLKYIHTVYKVNSWTDYGPAVVQNIASPSVSVTYSSPSNGVLRYTINVAGGTTYAVVKVNVTSGGSSNDPQTTVSIS